MSQGKPLRKNPSREACEKTIRRILITETLEHGSNRHFRSAADFMSYFESLYPASDALTKQVQRAIKAMDMPKDEQGYFIVNKTASQLEQENEIRHLFGVSEVLVDPMDNYDTVFVSAEAYARPYLIHLFESSESFRDKYLTIVESSNGLIIYTKSKNQLLILLNSLTIQP